MLYNETISYDPHCGLPNSEECETIRLLKKVIFGTTIVSDSVALFILILFRKYTSFSQRIFLNILLSNIVEGIGHLIDDGLNRNTCIFAAFLVQTFGFALFMWMCGLTTFLFLLIVKNFDSKGYERHYFITCWGIPLLLGLIPFFTSVYGPAGAFCWVLNIRSGRYLRFVIWWGPVMAGVLLIFIAFVTMYCKATIREQRDVESQLRPLTGYATSFVVLHTLMFIDRVRTIKGEPLYEMRILHIISISSYGLILCTLFYLTNGAKEFTKEKLGIALEYYKERFCCGGNVGSPPPFTTRMTIYDEETITSRTRPAPTLPTAQRCNHTDYCAEFTCKNEASHHRRQTKFVSTITVSDGAGPSRYQKSGTGQGKERDRIYPRHSPSTITELELSFGVPRDIQNLSLGVRHIAPWPKPPAGLPLDEKMGNVCLSQQTSSDKAVDDETSTIKITREILLQPMDHFTRMKPDHEYSLSKEHNAVKIFFVDSNSLIWCTCDDDTTIGTWAEDIAATNNSQTLIYDQDGALFHKRITWKQIRKTSSTITIVINGGITRIHFCKDRKEGLIADKEEQKELEPVKGVSGSGSETSQLPAQQRNFSLKEFKE